MIRRSTGKSRKRARVRIIDEFSEIKKKLYSDAASILEEGFSDIVKDTPVETGYAASNWKVSREGASESSAPPKILFRLPSGPVSSPLFTSGGKNRLTLCD